MTPGFHTSINRWSYISFATELVAFTPSCLVSHFLWSVDASIPPSTHQRWVYFPSFSGFPFLYTRILTFIHQQPSNNHSLTSTTGLVFSMSDLLRSLNHIWQVLNKIWRNPPRVREDGDGRKVEFAAGGQCRHLSMVQDTHLFCSCMNIYFKYLYKITESSMEK